MGIGNNTPSDRRNDSTTLRANVVHGLAKNHDRQVLPSVVFFIHEAIQRAEASVQNEFKIA